MLKSGFKTRHGGGLKSLSAGAFLFLVSACSNPMSSGQSASPQNFHSKNVNCDTLKLSNDHFSNTEIRGLIHCLNAHGEIEALEKLADATPDSELAPISAAIDQLVAKSPQSLYSLRAFYQNATKNGDLALLENTFSQMFVDSKANSAFTSVIDKISDPVFALLFDGDTHFEQDGIYALIKSKAYQRMGSEYFENDGLKRFLMSVIRYVNTPGSKSIQTLYHFLADAKVDEAFKAVVATNEITHIQNMAHFFEWLSTDDHYGQVSRNLREMMVASVVCFNSGKSIPDPVVKTLIDISKLDAKSVRNYFGHELKNTFLFAQGYCDFPYQKTPLFSLIDEATHVKGFDEVFLLVKPILSNPEFANFMASEASETFMKEMGGLSDKHFFQDLFTLASLHNESPLTTNGNHLAKSLDGIFKPLKETDVQNLLTFLRPILSQNNAYGEKTFRVIHRMSDGFPSVSTGMSTEQRSALQASAVKIIQKPELQNVFNLSRKLIENGKLNGIVDQMFIYLARAAERGRFVFAKVASHTFLGFSALSENYLVAKITDSPEVPTICDQLNLDWKFSQYSSTASDDYLKQIDALKVCVDPNQTFTSATDLIRYSISTSTYGFVLKAQRRAVDTLINADLNLAFTSAEHLLSINQQDSNTIRKLLDLTSSSVSLLKGAYLKYTELRKFLADLMRSHELIASVAELTDTLPTRLRSDQPTLDLIHLEKVDAILDHEQTLKQVPVVDAVKAIMMEYCPSLDDEMADCDIDADQVALFNRSPKLLYEQIAREELDSIQSWMHPKLATRWKHQPINPPDVSTFEYHLNPTLHQLNQSPQAPRAILNALARTEKDGLAIHKFLRTRAVRFVMIPYVYQVANFPEVSSKEFHPRTRIRILNDLDRLELIIINADFKAFNFVSNMGMNLLREIALAWGDVPESERPATLNNFVDSQNVKTLGDVRDYIQAEMNHYDRHSLEVLGNCDPRGRGRLGRWWATHFCSGKISDISARVFNLRFLIPLLDDEMPVKDGGHDGLVFLRDLFYSLYELNTDDQRGQFANGVSLNDVCLESPLAVRGQGQSCQKDLLTLVPRIAHLGLFHQAGMAVVQMQDHPIDAIGSMLTRVTQNKELSDLVVNVASSDAGTEFLVNSVEYGFQAPKGTGRNLSLIAQMLTLPNDLTWANLALELAQKDPRFPVENKALINTLLTVSAANLAPRIDHWTLDPKLPMREFLELFSKKLTPAARKDAISMVLDITTQSQTLAGYITTAKNLPAFETDHFKKDIHGWAEKFSSGEFDHTRNEFADWTEGAEFKQFCDVFSDSQFVIKAYNFLESANHDPGTQSFLESCREYLNPR